MTGCCRCWKPRRVPPCCSRAKSTGTEAPAPDAIPWLRSSRLQVSTKCYTHSWAYQFNFVGVRVRRAANHALNRGDFKEMLGGIAMEGFSTFPLRRPPITPEPSCIVRCFRVEAAVPA